MDLSGRCYLVTGSSGLLGGAIAAYLTRNGATVAGLDGAAPRSSGRACAAFIEKDLTEREGIDAAVDAAEQAIGPLNGLVHCVPVAQQVLPTDCSVELWEQTIHAHLTAVFALCQSVGRRLAERRSGVLIGLSSATALRPDAGNVPYGCANAGILGLFRAIALDLAPSGVRANIVIPGPVHTPPPSSLAGEAIDRLARSTMLGRIGEPEEIAATIAFLLSDEASFITGAALACDGGTILTGHRLA